MLTVDFHTHTFYSLCGIHTHLELIAEAKRLGLCLPGLALANQLYLSLSAHGHARAGTQALQLALAAMSNIDWQKR